MNTNMTLTYAVSFAPSEQIAKLAFKFTNIIFEIGGKI